MEPTPWCYRRQRERLGPSLQRAGTKESWWGSLEVQDEAGPRSSGARHMEACRSQAAKMRRRVAQSGE